MADGDPTGVIEEHPHHFGPPRERVVEMFEKTGEDRMGPIF
jgi:hypothetical protein